MKLIKKIWAGVFQLPAHHPLAAGLAAEHILLGKQDDTIRFTVEYEVGALPGLISMCRAIAYEQGVDWRLLQSNNLTEVSEAEIQEWLNCCSSSLPIH